MSEERRIIFRARRPAPVVSKPLRGIVAGLWFALLSILWGCASVQVMPYSRVPIATETIAEKNYELGQAREVVVGDPVVQVKSYQVTRYDSPRVRATSDFSLAGGDVRIRGSSGEEYQVRGTATLDGQRFLVVTISGYDLFVAQDGSIHDRVKIGGSRWMLPNTLEADPPELRFLPVPDEEISKASAYSNYELIFAGSDGDAIQLTYREFLPDDPVRPSFFQHLSYERSSPVIRFKSIVIKVLSVSNQSLSYAVLEDGS